MRVSWPFVVVAPTVWSQSASAAPFGKVPSMVAGFVYAPAPTKLAVDGHGAGPLSITSCEIGDEHAPAGVGVVDDVLPVGLVVGCDAARQRDDVVLLELAGDAPQRVAGRQATAGAASVAPLPW